MILNNNTDNILWIFLLVKLYFITSENIKYNYRNKIM